MKPERICIPSEITQTLLCHLEKIRISDFGYETERIVLPSEISQLYILWHSDILFHLKNSKNILPHARTSQLLNSDFK